MGADMSRIHREFDPSGFSVPLDIDDEAHRNAHLPLSDRFDVAIIAQVYGRGFDRPL